MGKMTRILSFAAASAAAAIAILPHFASAETEPQTVAHWTFGANGLTDITGNNAITLENHGVTFSDGGAVFDGSSYLVTTAPVELGATSNAFTIECWVKFDDKDYLGYIFAPSDASEKGAFVVYQYVVNGEATFFGQLRVVAPSTWQQEVGSIASLSTSYPHHIAYVVDGAKSDAEQAKLYLDGVQIANHAGMNKSGDFANGFGSRKLFIGAHGNNGSPNNGFKGRIDDIRITDGALEPSQFLKFPTICDNMTPAAPAFAHWTFGANGATDITGNGHNLVAVGSPVFDEGTLSLNGSSYLKADGTYPFSQFFKSGLTFECFFRTTDTFSADGAKILFETSTNQWGYSGNLGSFHLSFRTGGTAVSGGFRCFGTDAYNTQRTTGTPPLNDGRWHHAAIVYNPSLAGTKDVIRTYVDGMAIPDVDTSTAVSGLFDGQLHLGARINGQYYAMADMDEVRIMPYALTPAEFLFAPTPNAPIAHWKFGSATPLADATGNGNDLVNNGVTFADGAAVFNGSGASLKTASSLDLSAYRRATIECRYQTDNYSHFGPLFALETTASKTPGSFVVYKYSGSIWAQFGTTGGWHQDGITSVAAPYNAAGWHHIAYVLDVTRTGDDECIFYIDGIKQSQSSNKNTQTLSSLLNDKFCIGGGSSYTIAGNPTFDGKMSEIVVTPQALTINTFKLSRQPSGSGVIAYWDFSGSDWDDKSGNDHTLTATGMSKKNGAAQFADANASLATTATLDLSGCRSVTVECFAKCASASADMALFASGDGAAAGSFSASIAAAGGASSSYIPYAAAFNSDATASGGADGDWHHYALVIDGDAIGADQARLYVDGEPADSCAMASGATALLSAVFRIGGDAAGNRFTGLIDDVRITEGALSPAEFLTEHTETPDAFTIVVR